MPQQADQFEAGVAAFLADDDHLLYQCTPEFLSGYKKAFFEHAPKSEMDPHGENVEEYWQAHYSEAVTGMRERLLNAVMGTGAVVSSAIWGVAIGNLVMEVAKRI